MEKVFLGIGSNLGDKNYFLHFALVKLDHILADMRVSHFYETDPMYVTDQNSFLNAVVEGKTDIDPFKLLELVLGIENSAGRDRETVVRRGPRVLDIDLLLYGERIIRSETLVCPHPCMRERLFVLIPLLELDPDCIEPGTGIHYSDYRAALSGKDSGVRRV